MTPEQKKHYHQVAERLLAEQNFRYAVVFGFLATVACAAIWALLAAERGSTLGVLAVGVGVAVGYTVQYCGKGIQTRFVVLATVLAFAGCVLGSVLAVIVVESVHHQMPVIELLSGITAGNLIAVIVSNSGLIDLAFWIIAISAAGYIAKRRLDRHQQLAMFTRRFS